MMNQIALLVALISMVLPLILSAIGQEIVLKTYSGAAAEGERRRLGVCGRALGGGPILFTAGSRRIAVDSPACR